MAEMTANPSATSVTAAAPVVDKPSATPATSTAKKATATKSGNEGESIVEKVKRIIPGLAPKGDGDGAAAAPSSSSKSRSRSSKKKAGQATTSSGAAATGIAGADDPALASALTETAPAPSELPEGLVEKRPAQLTLNGGTADDGLNAEERAALEHKRFSPASVVQKRMKANGKKLQRITAYESETGTLNADQQRAVASKPALEAIQKEHHELIKVFETEELDDDKRAATRNSYQEKQVQYRVQQALKGQEAQSQNDITLLLQFLHLYSLFSPSNQGFNPPSLPPVVANATGQQAAAVHTLFNNLANGPLFGGSSLDSSAGDAISQIKALQNGSEQSVIEGISFADIKRMIADLTAPPNELPGHELSGANGSEGGFVDPVQPHPAVSSAVNESTGGPTLNFMQASELNASHSRQAAAEAEAAAAADAPEHQRALETVSGAATPGFGSQTPDVEKTLASVDNGLPTSESAAPAASGWDAKSGLTQGALQSGQGWAEMQSEAPIKSWADDVEDAAPVDPNTVKPEVPADAAAFVEGSANKDASGRGRGRGRGRGGDGSRGGYRGSGEGGYRGSGEGGYRGRGGDRRGGPPREGGDYNWRRSDAENRPAADAAIQAGENAGTTDGFTQVGGRGSAFRGNGSRGGSYRGTRGAPRGNGEFRGRGGRGYAPRGQSEAPVVAAT